MDTAEKIKEYEMSFANELREYGQKLRERYALDEREARVDACDALIRTGVIDKDGSPKKRIVTRVY